MTGAAHMLAATAIYGSARVSKPTALALAFSSHFLLDAIPHQDLSLAANLALGALVGAIILGLAWARHDFFLLPVAGMGFLPDLLWIAGLPGANQLNGFFHYHATLLLPAQMIVLELVLSLCLLAPQLLPWPSAAARFARLNAPAR